MDEHNFWYWLLTGVQNIAGVITGRLPVYAYIGLGQFVYNALVFAAAPILFYIGGLFNLCWFALAMAVMAASETARGAMAAYRMVIKMIPLP